MREYTFFWFMSEETCYICFTMGEDTYSDLKRVGTPGKLALQLVHEDIWYICRITDK